MQVPTTKNYMQWSWDAIMELLQGPLLNSKRLDEALNPKCKFVKRILSFLRPSSAQFSHIKKVRGSQRYVRAGVELMKVLVNSPDGIKFFAERPFLSQITNGIEQLIQLCVDRGTPLERFDMTFAGDKMRGTITADYFVFLGTLGKYDDGVRYVSPVTSLVKHIE